MPSADSTLHCALANFFRVSASSCSSLRITDLSSRNENPRSSRGLVLVFAALTGRICCALSVSAWLVEPSRRHSDAAELAPRVRRVIRRSSARPAVVRACAMAAVAPSLRCKMYGLGVRLIDVLVIRINWHRMPPLCSRVAQREKERCLQRAPMATRQSTASQD